MTSQQRKKINGDKTVSVIVNFDVSVVRSSSIFIITNTEVFRMTDLDIFRSKFRGLSDFHGKLS